MCPLGNLCTHAQSTEPRSCLRQVPMAHVCIYSSFLVLVYIYICIYICIRWENCAPTHSRVRSSAFFCITTRDLAPPKP